LRVMGFSAVTFIQRVLSALVRGNAQHCVQLTRLRLW
jgi:hypothetical protein